MLKRYDVNILEGGPLDLQRFSVHADTIDAAAIRAGYELRQKEPAEEIRVLSNYAYIAWESGGILCEIIRADE